MANNKSPLPPIKISNKTARRFMLAHQNLWPPRKLIGKKGIVELLDRLGCIQFDTINAVGRNADLVLQSRIKNYSPEMLNELLYKDRTLIDGWDKMASIYQSSDWPYFKRRRTHSKKYHHMRSEDTLSVLPEIMREIKKKGPMSSIEFEDDRRADWYWSETRLVRAALEVLYSRGTLGIHHRVNTRRIFDRIENLLPEKLLKSSDPNKTESAYKKWHLLRRLGSMGLASAKSGEYWLGMTNFRKVGDRREMLKKLIQSGDVLQVQVEGLEETLYMRSSDQPLLDKIGRSRKTPSQAAFIAPLDNLIWNRKLIHKLFNYYYVWEVYKPKAQRLYGYYVLPVLYQDKFIARMDSKMDRKTNTLHILNWWWEESVNLDEEMKSALISCFKQFYKFTNAIEIKSYPEIQMDKSLEWIPTP